MLLVKKNVIRKDPEKDLWNSISEDIKNLLFTLEGTIVSNNTLSA